MNDFVLTNAIRWLDAKDAFAVSCLSSEWRAIMAGDRDNGDLWKQVFINSFPLLAENLMGGTNDTNYRLLVLGLWEGISPTDGNDTPAFTPTLAPDDLFAVVEIYRRKEGSKRRKETIASWQCPITYPILIAKELGENNRQATLSGPNPYSKGEEDTEDAKSWRRDSRTHSLLSVPSEFAFGKIAGSDARSLHGVDFDKALRFNVTLFRRDNMKSFLLIDDSYFGEWESDYHNGVFEHELTTSDDIMVKFSSTDAGHEARRLMYDNGYSCLEYRGELTLAPKLPAPGSEEEPLWLSNCRRACDERGAYQPDDEDRATLATIPYFEFEIKAFEFELTKWGEDDSYEFETQDEMMTVLEGLCWR